MSEENIYKIYIECSNNLHTFLTEHDFSDYYNSDYFIRKAIDEFGKQWGSYPDICKYKLEDSKKWSKVDVKNYVF